MSAEDTVDWTGGRTFRDGNLCLSGSCWTTYSNGSTFNTLFASPVISTKGYRDIKLKFWAYKLGMVSR